MVTLYVCNYNGHILCMLNCSPICHNYNGHILCMCTYGHILGMHTFYVHVHTSSNAVNTRDVD